MIPNESMERNYELIKKELTREIFQKKKKKGAEITLHRRVGKRGRG